MLKLSTSDYVLIAYIVLLVPLMLIGFGFARRKMFVPYHKLTMTTITLVNWVLILSVMVVTYRSFVGPRLAAPGLSYSMIFIPTLHGLFGLTAQVLATYLVIRMWFEKKLPKRFKVKNIKRYMRTTLVLWLLTALLGLTTWAVFNRNFLSSLPTGGDRPAGTEQATSAPEATEEATASVSATRSATVPVSTKAATQPAEPGRTEEAAPGQTAESTSAR